ncbi:hypothetical protein [Ornithinimicrobium sp. INDO-MA30-4]|uniref:hypothetical protein n=1 Tax=Ornithinimicrobium sp. INDO-MA30-4 TaxID=2908651 RepID=UPI001F178253|nr:hypothetical protein [Ornithinimicrobium sp. INDO-MA30-4]UJH69982.1 hypothetical protein L0A91_12240 [Ornithinimicrobium sp. INDO-MA30-4]
MASREKADRQDDALGLARRVSALAIDSFPGSPLPNLIVHDLSALFQAGGWRLPLVEEPSPHDFEEVSVSASWPLLKARRPC